MAPINPIHEILANAAAIAIAIRALVESPSPLTSSGAASDDCLVTVAEEAGKD